LAQIQAFDMPAETETVRTAATINGRLRQFWPQLVNNLHSQSVQPSDIIQRLIEHRLALPFAGALDASTVAPNKALLSLAASLQSRQQPIADAQALREVLGAFQEAEIPVLVIKGLAYGYAFYADPLSRRSTDHDLLVAPESRLRAHKILLEMGFKADSSRVFHSICGQASYRKHVSPIWRHHGKEAAAASPVEIDLHWELGNNFALYRRFAFAELYAGASTVSIGSGAGGFDCKRPNDFFCAIHCALSFCSDSPTQRSYLALLDLALITQSFTTEEFQQLLLIAQLSQSKHVLCWALEQAKRLFGLDNAELSFDPKDPLLFALENRFKSGRTSDTANESTSLWWPLRTPRSLRAKLHYLLAQALPPSAYMRARYGADSAVGVLHWRRIVAAVFPRR
jgi:Uncharacterised nucleotidyltransferase